jgi:hypothetical protein
MGMLQMSSRRKCCMPAGPFQVHWNYLLPIVDFSQAIQTAPSTSWCDPLFLGSRGLLMKVFLSQICPDLFQEPYLCCLMTVAFYGPCLQWMAAVHQLSGLGNC